MLSKMLLLLASVAMLVAAKIGGEGTRQIRFLPTIPHRGVLAVYDDKPVAVCVTPGLRPAIPRATTYRFVKTSSGLYTIQSERVLVLNPQYRDAAAGSSIVDGHPFTAFGWRLVPVDEPRNLYKICTPEGSGDDTCFTVGVDLKDLAKSLNNLGKLPLTLDPNTKDNEPRQIVCLDPTTLRVDDF